ncbi:MAG: hypothetical protein OXF79_00755 [Chloroflexi bacterium]|nr:hypothetical protein [Chloroflexota bacterium]
MSDLLYAPSPFVDATGRQVIFVDFLKACYRLTFDVKKRRATALSEITFRAAAAGHAVILLNQPLRSVHLNGKPIKLLKPRARSHKARLTILSETVNPGIHSLVIRSRIQRKQGRDKEYPVNWFNGSSSRSGSLECIFNMSDIAPQGGFLDRYLPANYNFDHFDITFEVSVENSEKAHRVFCNGDVTKLTKNHWKVRFPSFFTSSCPWFHLVPGDRFKVLKRKVKSLDGRVVPLTIYTKHTNNADGLLDKFRKHTKRFIEKLETDFGPFPHRSVTIYAKAGKGKGGMEYAGATATKFGSLRHELDHSYFARGVIPCNGNAGWIDEAIAMWGDKGYKTAKKKPLGRGSKLGGQCEYDRTTNRQAYTVGRKFLEHLDYVLRKSGGLKKFLRTYAHQKSHESVSAAEFQAMVEKFDQGAQKKVRKLFNEYIN